VSYVSMRTARSHRSFKIYLKLTLLKSTVVRVPFYYDTLNLEIDNILMRVCINQIEKILTDYGYKTNVTHWN
jgi:hypothetical protein